jgi:HD superfamily phosphohydrolase
VTKLVHEVRDPVHVFVRLDTDERKVLDSKPFQRLRHIHQLGMTYLLYPGATHRRFEHSLGVMEMASRVFDVVTRTEKIIDEIRDLLREIENDDARRYWRRVLRMAALCHDLGHLPFSHTAEKELLPAGWEHERLTREIICDREMQAIWETVTPPLRTEDLVKLAVGPKKAADLSFTNWETVLAEIIVGDAFGVDRMDYLLRDSHHIGVAYGKFDHYRLIDTLRILPAPPSDESEASLAGAREPSLGVEEGGLQSAEALLLARYFMYSQVYFHPLRRIYDTHLKDFLRDWLPEGTFSTNLKKHLALTDNEISAAFLKAAFQPEEKGHDHARRIVEHNHFKRLYVPSRDDLRINPDAGAAVFHAAKTKFGPENLRYDRYAEKGQVYEFPVFSIDNSTVSSTSRSQVLGSMPLASVDCVFVDGGLLKEAIGWLEKHKASIIQPEVEIP